MAHRAGGTETVSRARTLADVPVRGWHLRRSPLLIGAARPLPARNAPAARCRSRSWSTQSQTLHLSGRHADTIASGSVLARDSQFSPAPPSVRAAVCDDRG